MGKRWDTWKLIGRMVTVLAATFFVILYLLTVNLTVSSFERISQLLFYAIIFTTPADVVIEALIHRRGTKNLELNVNILPVKIGAICAVAIIFSSMVLDFPYGTMVAFWSLGAILIVYMFSLLILPLLIHDKPKRKRRKKRKTVSRKHR